MQRNRQFVFTLALLFTLCLFSACVSPFAPANQTAQMPSPNTSPRIDVGILPVVMTQEPELVSFDDAKGNLKDSESLSLNQLLLKTRILFIQGGNFDETGYAGLWVFGVNKGKINELRIYDRTGWTIIPWDATISAEEIDLDRVVSPKTLLFNQTMESSPSTMRTQGDIELRNGTYTITMISGNTSQVMRFNATTGEVIE